MPDLPLSPLNDHLLVKVDDKYGPFGTGDDAMGQGGYESGTVVSISKYIAYFSAPGWTFPDTLMDKEKLEAIKDHYEGLVGKKVYWEKYSERGQTVDVDGVTYAFIRFTKLTGVSNKE